ncbi:hypothetical protein GCM10007874_40340 [Labrys miyagiensis]|uniref:ABC transporter domain-containing protein n=2 Tax=Labrys miyagiensis TaxID=346912 RepID=A0ABQ6CKY9_9HYPH|nr:hypothetical protein GCM10007874_40340 [Labrys miyagiensis]
MTIAGFVRPDSGSLRIGDRDVTRLSPNKRDIGIVFQNYALFPHMNVLANVEYPLHLRNVPRREARERARAALARVKLNDFENRNIAALSGGQRQRVALARAIVYEPRVMLMDEPLSALDKNLREQMQFEIRKLHDDLGITTIYVTHDQREALIMSDRIAVMDAGVIRQIDTPHKIYQHPNSSFVADFMGEANILPGSAVVALTVRQPAEMGTLMIRAENFHLEPSAVGADGVSIRGKMTGKAFRGENWLLHLDIGVPRQVLLSIPSTQSARCEQLQPGAEITAYAARAHLHSLGEAKLA